MILGKASYDTYTLYIRIIFYSAGIRNLRLCDMMLLLVLFDGAIFKHSLDIKSAISFG